ncbi:MAG TPA: hypothetical protein DCM62_09155, partial [Bacteroidales bacterium]|nr:hypothetical protein [Bacteroidales bacterium]
MNKKAIPPIEVVVEGMTCSNCALGIQKTLEKAGVKEVFVDFATGSVTYKPDEFKNTQEIVIARIESLGYKVKAAPTGVQGQKKGYNILAVKFWISAVFTLPLVLAMFVPVPLLHNSYFQLLLTIPVFIIGVTHFGKSAFYSIRSGVANMDV